METDSIFKRGKTVTADFPFCFWKCPGNVVVARTCEMGLDTTMACVVSGFVEWPIGSQGGEGFPTARVLRAVGP